MATLTPVGLPSLLFAAPVSCQKNTMCPHMDEHTKQHTKQHTSSKHRHVHTHFIHPNATQLLFLTDCALTAFHITKLKINSSTVASVGMFVFLRYVVVGFSYCVLCIFICPVQSILNLLSFQKSVFAHYSTHPNYFTDVLNCLLFPPLSSSPKAVLDSQPNVRLVRD